MSLVEIRKQMAEQKERHLECRTCRTPTAYDTLSSYGGLCGPCYGAYCRAPLKAAAVWTGPRGNAGDAVKEEL